MDFEGNGEGLCTPAETKTEYVVVVPNRLTKAAYQVLIDNQWVARPWHLEGRYGSRTHKINDKCCGIPILPLPELHHSMTNDALTQLLSTERVAILERPITISNRIPKVQLVDASIHPERSPTEKFSSTIFKGSTEFTFIELFSGIGGFGLALKALGGRCVFASELDEACRAVYANNMGPVPLFGDIYQVPDSLLPSRDDDIDLLVGGFPCQPFSNLGTQPGFDDKVKGQLYLQIVRVLQVSKPKAFLLENVPGLLHMTEAFHTIVSALESAGYQVSTQEKGNSQLVPCPAPRHPRRFSPMECARIMGFPASTFAFLTQSETQGDMAFVKKQFHMFGNAVCPPLIAAIAGAVIGSCRPREHRDAWVVRGRTVAIQLAVSAVLPSRQDLTWTRLRCEYPNLFDTLEIEHGAQQKQL
ncbi:C-5 cytosine-specific DNA methylase [Fragilaria crotonensis]|nr:C-5 cytosine-specific DNA methylase [Fragilaria crotonensis]